MPWLDVQCTYSCFENLIIYVQVRESPSNEYCYYSAFKVLLRNEHYAIYVHI